MANKNKNPDKITENLPNAMVMALTSEDEIKTIIKNKNNKAPGIDDIEVKTLKEVCEFVTTPLKCIIINA